VITEINDRVADKAQDVPMVVRYAKPKEPSARNGSASAFSASFSPALPYVQAAAAYGVPGYNANPGAAYGAQYGAPAAYAPAAPNIVGGATGSTRRGPPGSNLYVNNLDRFVTEDDVRQMFSDFGNVISVKLFQGYGFVSYDSAQSAQAAIAALNGMMSSDGRRRLEVSLKKDKGEGAVRGAAGAAGATAGPAQRYTPY